MSIDDVEWRSIPGYPGYMASNIGQIRSPRGRILKPWRSNPLGHLKVRLGGGSRSEWAHRVVASAFHGPCPPGLETRHLDGDPTNNRANNLRYGTHSENMLDRTLHGNVPNRGDECPRGHSYGPDRICWECQFVAKKDWVRKNVGVYVECDNCGRTVSKLNLTKHKRTARCRGAAL